MGNQEFKLRTLVFRNGSYLEKEDLDYEIYQSPNKNQIISNLEIVDTEIYGSKYWYDMHYLLKDREGYKYVTIQCTDIQSYEVSVRIKSKSDL